MIVDAVDDDNGNVTDTKTDDSQSMDMGNITDHRITGITEKRNFSRTKV